MHLCIVSRLVCPGLASACLCSGQTCAFESSLVAVCKRPALCAPAHCLTSFLFPEHASLDRRGDAVDRALLKSVLRMFSALHIYSTAFEGPFLRETRTFYQQRGQEMLQQYEVRDARSLPRVFLHFLSPVFVVLYLHMSPSAFRLFGTDRCWLPCPPSR